MEQNTTEQLRIARDWIADASSAGERLSDEQTYNHISRHYEGGWMAFLAERWRYGPSTS